MRLPRVLITFLILFLLLPQLLEGGFSKMLLLICALTLVTNTLAVPMPFCPKSCTCDSGKPTLELKCKSFDFLANSNLKKLHVTKLEVNGANLNGINKNLVKLKNLTQLSLNSNKITRFTASQLPSSLTYLDISYNRITHIPQDLTLLSNLKRIKTIGNPISCTCDALLVRNLLIDGGLEIDDVKCDSPKELYGKSFLSVECSSLFGEMQNDAAYEGSGFEEVEETTSRYEDGAIEDEFMRQTVPDSANNTEPIENEENEVEDEEKEEEGSGFSHSDFNETDNATNVEEVVSKRKQVPLEEEPLKACNFNCSTPSPLDGVNESYVSPAPGFFEGIGIIVSDLDIISDKGTTTTTEEDVIEDAVDVDRSNVKENQTSSSIKEANEQINPTFVFLGILVMLMTCFIIYAVIKRRTTRQKRYEKEDELGEEMTPIKLKPDMEISNGIPENDPLLNGHEDNRKSDVHENNKHIVPNGKDDGRPPITVEYTNNKNEYPDIDANDKKPNDYLLTPEAKRVTIRAAELPDSIPKTPVLVNRRINSDGTVITTPNE